MESHAVTMRPMTNQSLVPTEISERYEVREWRNGLAVLAAAHAGEWADILAVLKEFRLLRSDILKPGGSKGLIASRLDSHFARLGRAEKKFDTKIIVDKAEHAAPTHKVDCYKNRWRSKWSGTTRIHSTTAT